MTLPKNAIPLRRLHSHQLIPAIAPMRWERRDWTRTGGLLAVIAAHARRRLRHPVPCMVAPHHYTVGTQVFGLGLGVTAYTLGMRHAFDADHIAAIDNTTRKLMADGKRPVSVGFWFALGHSTIVVVAGRRHRGRRRTSSTRDRRQLQRRTRCSALVSTSVSGTFLYLIAALNLVVLLGIITGLPGHARAVSSTSTSWRSTWTTAAS